MRRNAHHSGRDALDIQPFVNTLFDPSPNPQAHCIADLVPDGVLDIGDVSRFVCLLLGSNCDELWPCGSQGDSFALQSAQSEESSQKSEPSATQPYRMSDERLAQIEALLDWYYSHPRENYSELTDREYADMTVDMAILLGLFDFSEEEP